MFSNEQRSLPKRNALVRPICYGRFECGVTNRDVAGCRNHPADVIAVGARYLLEVIYYCASGPNGDLVARNHRTAKIAHYPQVGLGMLAPTIHQLGKFPVAVKATFDGLLEINSQLPVISPDHFTGSGRSHGMPSRNVEGISIVACTSRHAPVSDKLRSEQGRCAFLPRIIVPDLCIRLRGFFVG